MPDGATALHWAAHWNDAATVDALIRAGANVNAATDIGVTPLWLACSDGGPAIVTSLLKAGANPNTAPPSGESPLMAAARTGHVESVRALLAHGADVNARDVLPRADRVDVGGRAATPRCGAGAARCAAPMSMPVRRSAAPRFVAGNRNGTGHNAEEQRRLSVEFDEGGYTALLFAAQQDDVDSARLLVEAGADVHDTAPVGTSALVVAVHSDSARVAAFLLEKGADPNADGAGYTALHAAVLRGNPALVKALLARGANPNAKLTRPTAARRYGNEWAFGDNLVGATPFYLAAKFGELELMRTLAAAKADPSLPAHDGSTPLMMALDTPTVARRRRGRVRHRPPRSLRVDQRRDAGAAGERGAGHRDRPRSSSGGDVNQADANGNTALHLAATKSFNRLIELLVAQGRPGQRQERRGQTPLALADGAACGRRGATAHRERERQRKRRPPRSRPRLRCCESSAPPTDAPGCRHRTVAGHRQARLTTVSRAACRRGSPPDTRRRSPTPPDTACR